MGSVVEGVPVPATYQVGLRGAAAGVAFGPLTGELCLAAAGVGAYPVRLTIATGAGLDDGDLMWLASTPGLTAQDTGDCRMRVACGEIHAALTAPHGALAVSFTARGSGPYVSRSPVPTAPVAATIAQLWLRFAGHEVTGQVRATGLLMGEAVEYAAAINGVRCA